MVVARRFGIGALAAVLLLSIAFLAPGGAGAQSVSIDPGAAPAGTTVVASGAGWASGISVRVEWSDGTVLADVEVADDGSFSAELTVPAAATPGEYVLRFVGYVPPYVVDCTVDSVEVTFTVLATGVTATAGTGTATATATATPAATGTTEPTIVATQCATATSATETVTGTVSGTTTAEPTGTAVTETAVATATATASPTATATATATATRTPTATPTKTPTKVPTKTPTKVGFPGTGSAGLLDQDDDGSGSPVPVIVAAVVLGAGVTSAGVLMYRRRVT